MGSVQTVERRVEAVRGHRLLTPVQVELVEDPDMAGYLLQGRPAYGHSARTTGMFAGARDAAADGGSAGCGGAAFSRRLQTVHICRSRIADLDTSPRVAAPALAITASVLSTIALNAAGGRGAVMLWPGVASADTRAQRRLQTLGEIAHEFTHALQSQHLPDLSVIPDGADASSDARLARAALVEGDAQLTGLTVSQGQRRPPGRVELTKLSRQVRLAIAEQAGPGISESDAQILGFQYGDGLYFAGMLQLRAGYPLVDAAFYWPPQTTAQVLHPELWAKDVQPEPVDLQDRYLTDGGWQRVDSDRMGELLTSVYWGRAVGLAKARHDAMAWRGDTLVHYQYPSGAQLTVWRSAWVDEAAAAVALANMTTAHEAAKGDTRPLAASRSGRSVLVTRGLSGEQHSALAQRLSPLSTAARGREGRR